MDELKKLKLNTPLEESNIVFNEVYTEEYAIRGYSLDMELDVKDINYENYLQLCEVANKQYDFFVTHKQLSGYCIVDWRVIFSALFDYIDPTVKSGTDNALLLEFYNNYEINSAPELYKRLGLEY